MIAKSTSRHHWISRLFTLQLGLQLGAWAIFIGGTQLAQAAQTYTGDITAYGAQSSNQFCGFIDSSWEYGGMLTAAINQPQVDNSLACGMCAAVTHQTPAGNKTVTVLIDNMCPECKEGDLDLSQQAWQAIVGDKNYGRKRATWSWVDCGDRMINRPNANILLRAHSPNYWWIAMNPSNMRCGIRRMWMRPQGKDWIDMTRDNGKMNGLWFILQASGEPFRAPLRFKMESVLGDVVESDDIASLEDMLAPRDIKKQFACDAEEDCGRPMDMASETPAPQPAPTPARTVPGTSGCYLRAR